MSTLDLWQRLEARGFVIEDTIVYQGSTLYVMSGLEEAHDIEDIIMLDAALETNEQVLGSVEG